MPGSAYYNIAKQTAEWLSVVNECCINTSSKSISDKLDEIVLKADHELVSFDIVSLYTNVPVLDAINVCADLLYSGEYKKPPVDKETFIELLKICSENVIMLTHDGLYRQKDLWDGLCLDYTTGEHQDQYGSSTSGQEYSKMITSSMTLSNNSGILSHSAQSLT